MKKDDKNPKEKKRLFVQTLLNNENIFKMPLLDLLMCPAAQYVNIIMITVGIIFSLRLIILKKLGAEPANDLDL